MVLGHGGAVNIIHLNKHQTKGNRSRRVFIGDELRKILTTFLSYSTKRPDTAPLIASTRKGKHTRTVTLSTRLKSIYRAAGTDTSSHAGRRTFAKRKNELGIGMATIQQLMGHSSISDHGALLPRVRRAASERSECWLINVFQRFRAAQASSSFPSSNAACISRTALSEKQGILVASNSKR